MAEPTTDHYQEAVDQLASILEIDKQVAGTPMLPQAATIYYSGQANGIAIAQLRATLALVEQQKRIADFFDAIPFGSWGGPIVEPRS